MRTMRSFGPRQRPPWGLLVQLLVLLMLALLPSIQGFILRPRTAAALVHRRRGRATPPTWTYIGTSFRLACTADAGESGQSQSDYVLSGPTSDDERTFVVPATVTDPGLPLPEIVQVYGEFSSPSKARKLIRRGQVWVNGKVRTCQDRAVGGDSIEVRAPEPRVKRKDGKLRGVKKIRVVFEDDDIAVIVKPAGVAVHGTGAYSLVDRYAEFLAPTTRPEEEEALPKPVHAHRLDAPVGGLLIVAKTRAALRELTSAFEERRVHKRYRAVVIGRPPAAEGSVTEPVDEKEALTRYALVSATPSADFGFLSQLDLFPETGRKHQLRVHCAQGLGTPILGDIRYGPEDTLRTRGLFLFSYGLAFAHPVTGEALEFEVELPEIYANTVNMERKKAEGMAEAAAAAEAAAGQGDAQDAGR